MELSEAIVTYRYIPSLVTSSVFYLCCFYVVSPWLSRKIFGDKFCLRLTKQQRVDWNTRLGSTINAVIVSVMCIASYFNDTNNRLAVDPLVAEEFWPLVVASLTVGYFLADMIIILTHWNLIGDVAMLVHHVSYSVVVAWMACLNGLVVYFGYLRGFGELSTPSVNLRWCLDALKTPKTSRLFMSNGIAMAVLFFVFRVAIIPQYYIVLLQLMLKSTSWTTLNVKFKVVFLVCSVATDFLNVLWMRKILKGCLKVLRGQSTSDAATRRVPRSKRA